MKILLTKICATDSTKNGGVIYNCSDRTVTFKLAFPNEEEENLVYKIAGNVLGGVSLSKLKDVLELRSQYLKLNTQEFENLITMVKNKGIDVSIYYPTAIIVGYIESPYSKYSEGVYIIESGEITELSEKGIRAVFLLIGELSRL